MRIREYINSKKKYLSEHDVPDASYDAKALFLHAFHMDTARLLYVQESELSELSFDPPSDDKLTKYISDYESLIEQRAKRVPLQQLIGTCGFYGMEFKVSSAVLCPRQDTELLVDLAIENVDNPAASFLDLCTGSGCIAISLMKSGKFSHGMAVDISKDALEVAHANVSALLSTDEAEALDLAESDMFSALSGDVADPEAREKYRESFDIIVSNPPYIRSEVVDTLEPEVREYEPRIALDGDADGLKFYREIAKNAATYLKARGKIYVEIGFDQGAEVSALFTEAGLSDVRVHRDLAGNDRVVSAVKSDL